jgi:hypothetical protein
MRKDKRNKLIAIGILFVLILIAFVSVGGLFKFQTVATGQPFFWQICGNPSETWSRDLLQSCSSIVSGYTINVDKFDRVTSVSCNANTCNGQPAGKDSYGCDSFLTTTVTLQYPVSAYYVTPTSGGGYCPAGSWCEVTTGGKKGSGDYEIKQSYLGGCNCASWVYHSATPPPCQPNSCGGTQNGVDKYNCPIYEITNTVCGNTPDYGNCRCCERLTAKPTSVMNECMNILGSGTGLRTCDYARAYNGWTSTWDACHCTRQTLTCGTAGTQCGGSTVTDNWGVAYNYRISLNGEIVSEDQTRTLGSEKTVDFTDLSVQLDTENKFQYYSTYYIGSHIYLKFPANAIDVEIIPSKSSFIQGEDASIQVKVANTYKSVKGVITLTATQPTLFGTQSGIVYSETKDIPLGNSLFTLTIPTSKIAEKVDLVPTLEISGTPSQLGLQGVNVNKPYCNPNGNYRSDTPADFVPVTWCDSIKIGTFTGDTKTIQVVPKPLVLDVNCPTESCPTGYTCKPFTTGAKCLSNDVLNVQLTCQQLGCPAETNTLHYYCTSSGICAEQVFIARDCRVAGSECPEGLSCQVSADGTFSYCMKTEFITQVTQCLSTANCTKPCNGVTTTCRNGLCDYSGSCTPTTISKQIGCKELGCSSGYVCDLDRNVCNRSGGIAGGVNPLYLIFVFIVFIIIILGIVYFKKFR